MTPECNTKRQITYWGKDNQARVNKSAIAIIGVGGLGSVAAEILCRMGVGKLVLCDFDVVADHNLSRQHLYDLTDIGQLKVVAAKKHLKAINPSCNITIVQEEAKANSMEWCKNVDVVLDCTDKHISRREIDAFCAANNLPWVHGAAVEEHGSVFAFLPDEKLRYDDIYQNKTTNFTCKERGVLATITTLVGTWQASFALQIILEKTVPKTLLRIRADNAEVEHIAISREAL